MENERKLYAAIGILFLLVAATAVISALLSVESLLYEIFCAIIGVVLTAAVTVALLQGQTDAETKQSRSAKVYEEKLQIYKDFLKALCDVLEDGKITEKESVRLQFQFATITMHTGPNNAEAISDSIKNIAGIFGEQDSMEGDSSLMKELLNIVNALREELYDEDKKLTDEQRARLIENFGELEGQVTGEGLDSQDAATSGGGQEDANALEAFNAKMKDALQPWADSVGATVGACGSSLRIKSSLIGNDKNDWFGWGFIQGQARLAICQLGMDKASRKVLYQKTKHFGYPATYWTPGTSQLFPRTPDERYLFPGKSNGKDFNGAYERVKAGDKSLIEFYVGWIKDVYQKFGRVKENSGQ